MSAHGHGHETPPPSHGEGDSGNEAPTGPIMQSRALTVEAKHGEKSTDYYISDIRGLDVVADGTTKILSYEAANAFAEAIGVWQPQIAQVRGYDNGLRSLLQDAVGFANNRVREVLAAQHGHHGAEDSQVAMTAAVQIDERRFAVVHAGDSIAIVVRKNGTVRPLTEQHILDQQALENARQHMPPDKFEDLKRNIQENPHDRKKFQAGRLLFGTLDGSPNVRPHISFVTLDDGDILALATNDVIGNTPEDRVELEKLGTAIVKNRHHGDLSVVAKAVATLRKHKGAEDRTVIIKRVGSPEHFPKRSIWTLLGRQATKWPPLPPAQYGKVPHEEHAHHDDGGDENHEVTSFQMRAPSLEPHTSAHRSDWGRNYIGPPVALEDLERPADPPEPVTERLPIQPTSEPDPEPSLPPHESEPDNDPTQQLPVSPPEPDMSPSSNRINTLKYVATAAAGIVIAGITAELLRRRKKRLR